MKPINIALLKVAKRAEQHSREYIEQTFVDFGHVFTLLSNSDHQIIYGRRGTGKTHVLGYLVAELQNNGTTAIDIDMRTMGSTGGIYSDSNTPLKERATRLLVDTLCAIHDKILDQALANDAVIDLSRVGAALDRFINAAIEVKVEGQVSVEESNSTEGSASRTLGTVISQEPQVNAEYTSKLSATRENRISRSGTEVYRVHFGSVQRELQSLLTHLPSNELWIAIDEWSEIPLDLQPYLADLLRRTVFPTRGVSVKIAAIEQRTQFRIPDTAVGHIGIEVGADAATSINLDEFLVFDNNPEQSKEFFKELLFRHIKAIGTDIPEIVALTTSDELIREAFTQMPAFEESVRSSEGVPRDAINIISNAATKAGNEKISIHHIRAAAHTWYLTAKQSAISTKPDAIRLLNWIVDEVIRGKRARAFLLRSNERHELIEFLFDARAIHLIKQGVSAQDQPGQRFNVFSIDYGCYVDLINTSNAPQGLLIDQVDGVDKYTDVPLNDFRSIRRSILDLSTFPTSA